MSLRAVIRFVAPAHGRVAYLHCQCSQDCLETDLLAHTWPTTL